jgi:DNA-binding transcriptional LysR family regulator
MVRLDLNLLPVVVALYDRRSVSQAAVSLGMSQPAVSSALGKLRQFFDDPLFVRTARGMEPTPRAVALIGPARAVLARVDNEIIADVAFDPAKTNKPFTFALSDAGEMIFLPRILNHLTQRAPETAIKSISLPAPDVERGLESGEIDLAIGYFPDLRKSNFFQQRLFTDRFASLVRADHPISGGNRLTMKQFLEMKHAVVRAESRSEEVLERYLTRKRIQRQVVLQTPHFTSIPMIVAQSDLIVTVPEPLAAYFSNLAANLRMVSLPLQLPRIDIKQHWHRKFHHDARTKWLRTLVSEIYQTHGESLRSAARLDAAGDRAGSR